MHRPRGGAQRLEAATGADLTTQRILFYGAGEAGVGIGELIAMALEKRGMSHHDAINRCYFMDSKGLVCKQRLERRDPAARVAAAQGDIRAHGVRARPAFRD